MRLYPGREKIEMDYTERTFQNLHDTFRPKILRYLTGMVGEHDAEDLTQDVFLKVNRSLKDFNGNSQVSTWIYRIATNTALDKLRSPSFKRTARDQSSKTPVSIDEKLVEDKNVWNGQKTSSAEDLLIEKDTWACIRDHIDKIPSRNRTVLVLSLIEGMKNKEIAGVVGATLDTVKIRLHRGKAQLRKEISAHCGWYRDARDCITWDGKRI